MSIAKKAAGTGRIFIISAPSGAGKGAVIDKVLELSPEIAYSVSATTRPPRKGEIDGVSYHFVSRERFEKMIADDEFLEYAEYVGEYYGTPKRPIRELTERGKDVILEIEVQGARQIMALVPDALSIFIVTPSLAELERRLRKRGTDSGEKLVSRLHMARQELQNQSMYGRTVVNDDVERAAREILAIIGQASCAGHAPH